MTTREQLIKALEGAKQNNLSIGECWNLMDAAANMLESDGVPVAWRWVWKSRPDDIDGWCYTNTPPLYPDKQIIEPLYTAPQTAMAWQPIETAPKDGRVLLLGYRNSHGNWRTMRGEWLSQAYIDEYFEDPDMAEPGWFETSVEADGPPNCWGTNPTHWMPLPPAPGAAPQTAIQERKPLTDEQIDAIGLRDSDYDDVHQFRRMARAIESAHGIGAKP